MAIVTIGERRGNLLSDRASCRSWRLREARAAGRAGHRVTGRAGRPSGRRSQFAARVGLRDQRALAQRAAARPNDGGSGARTPELGDFSHAKR